MGMSSEDALSQENTCKQHESVLAKTPVKLGAPCVTVVSAVS